VEAKGGGESVDCRLGQLLVEQGILTTDQVELILKHQRRSGKPFGLLCEHIFDVDPDLIENAWAAQYARIARKVDPEIEVYEQRALELITRRQAWQFRILPIRFDDNELMIATSQQHLRRALRFAVNVIGLPVYLVMADADKLGMALCRFYELPGMTPDLVENQTLDRLLIPPTARS